MTDCPLCRIPRFLLKPREAFQEVRNEPLSVAAFTLIPLVVLFAVLFTGSVSSCHPASSSGRWRRWSRVQGSWHPGPPLRHFLWGSSFS